MDAYEVGVNPTCLRNHSSTKPWAITLTNSIFLKRRLIEMENKRPFLAGLLLIFGLVMQAGTALQKLGGCRKSKIQRNGCFR